MVLVEMRESAYSRAFDLLDKAKEGNKKTKLALCELYDCLQQCYESDTEDAYEDEYEHEEEVVDGDNYADIDNVEIGEINYRRGGLHRAMRHHNEYPMTMRKAMRKGMRRGMRHSRYSY